MQQSRDHPKFNFQKFITTFLVISLVILLFGAISSLPGNSSSKDKDDSSENNTNAGENGVVEESDSLFLNVRGYSLETSKYLYNVQVNTTALPAAENYDVIIYDKSYSGTFTTNSYGVAIVVNEYGILTEIYDGANVKYYKYGDAVGAATAHFTCDNYAITAWAELQDGETLIIFPNQWGDNATRSWALGLRETYIDTETSSNVYKYLGQYMAIEYSTQTSE